MNFNQGIDAAHAVLAQYVTDRAEEARRMRSVPGGGPGSAYAEKALSIEACAGHVKRLAQKVLELKKVPHPTVPYCDACKEKLAPDQTVCPFCEAPAGDLVG